MDTYEPIGAVIVLAAALVATTLVARRLPPELVALLWISVGLRVVGATMRYVMLTDIYGGVGDATGYYGHGRAYADAIWSLDWHLVDDGRARLMGTSFVRLVSGLVLSVIGPSMFGEFLFFAFMALIGLWLIGLAVRSVDPAATDPLQLRLLLCAPSLVFWPSSVGKEAILLLALGLVVFGYVCRHVRGWWAILGAGLLLCALVRAHVAAIVALSLVLAEVLPDAKGWTKGRLLKLVALAIVAAAVVAHMGQSFQFDPTDPEEVRAFIDRAAQRTVQGGSRMEVASGPLALLQALINVFLRPFPWEAINAGTFLAGAEMLLIWGLIFWRRAAVTHALWTWWRHPALRLTIPCGLVLAVAFGLTFFNMGILVRQRALSMALLFTVFAVRRPEPDAPEPDAPEVAATVGGLVVRPRWRDWQPAAEKAAE